MHAQQFPHPSIILPMSTATETQSATDSNGADSRAEFFKNT
jgi:hypothetical protein